MDILALTSFIGGLLYVLDKAYHAALEYWAGKPPYSGEIIKRRVGA